MTALAASFLAALATLAVLDGLWLGLISRRFYQARLGCLLRDRPRWMVALVFYVIHAAGVVVFAVPPAGWWVPALLYGAAFGFCVYAAYDITNLATLRGWPMAVTLIDLAWGTVATAIASGAAFITMGVTP